MRLFTFIMLLFSFTTQAEVITVSHDYYEQALDSTPFIHFDMSSTKLGTIKSSFTGVVRRFKAEYMLHGTEVTMAEFRFQVNDMDTNNSSRNDKMRNYCLAAGEHPEIIVESLEPFDITQDRKVRGAITVRGEAHLITIEVKSKREDGKWVIDGTATVKLSELKIPDPSIAVASVRDEVLIRFQLRE